MDCTLPGAAIKKTGLASAMNMAICVVIMDDGEVKRECWLLILYKGRTGSGNAYGA